MKKKARPEQFLHKPKYPGGKKALDEFIRMNLKYPEEAFNKKIEGIVSLKFDTDEYGVVGKVQLIHGIGHGCNEEAIRLIKLLRFEKTKKAGLHVTFHQTMNIHFKLPNPAAPQAGTPQIKMDYQYTEKSPPRVTKSYTYTIPTGKK